MLRGAALAAVLAVAVGAAAQAPQVTMIGVGAGVTCTAWRQEHANDSELVQWAYGFASAMAASAQAQHGMDTLARLDAGTIASWLDNYCTTWPDHGLSLALVRLIYSATH